MSKMAASETVRVRLQFDYPPPATPHCTVFWLLVDLNRCRVVTDLISLIRQRFGFSSGALLGLYLEGGLLPPSESARLVRDNDCLRVKLEDQGLPEALIVSNGGDSNFPCRKSKKRAFKLVEDEETDQGYKYPDKYWKRQEDSGPNEKASDLETKLFPDEVRRTKNKRKSKVAGIPAEEDEEETKKKSSKRKEKCEQKKQTRASKSPKQQTHKEGGSQNCSFPRASYRSSLAKARRRSSTGAKGSPSYLSESESCPDSVSDGHCSVTTMQGVTLSEKLSAELLKDGATKTAAANRQSSKPSFTFSSGKGKASRASSSSSDSSSESEDQFLVSKNMLEGASDFLKTTGLFAGQGCSSPGLSLETPGIMGWKPSDSNRGRQAPGPNVPVPTSLGRGWGRGEDFLFGKGLRGRGIRGRGRGRGQTVSCILNRSSESQKQKQLNDILTNSSTVIQNPVETSKKDYSLLPLLAAAPQVGEKIAFKLLELTSDYSPDVSDYKEGKILSHDPETQQVDIEVLSSLPALKEPGKFDLVYHNENGTEVVEYAVTQEKRITVFWKELIDPRLIIDSSSSISNETQYPLQGREDSKACVRTTAQV
ncbi:coilin isoform X1 [Rattus norvegicus]|uniref:Coilin n=1 Tax=Rattus norvegicus TaxID=10116 RepID=E9PTJ1_RAT|nr:coilin isoform X1 [Rattus norvegicus]